MSSDALEQINYYNEDDVPYQRNPNVIASGASTVQKAKRKDSEGNRRSWPYAQKTFMLDNNDNRDVIIRAFKAEVRILRHAKHRHVIDLIDAFELREEDERPQLAIVMPFTESNINDYLTGKKRGPSLVRQWFYCLASVVEYIHGIGIRHRDIKPTNILVSKGKVFLADFGISSMGFVQTLSTTMPAIAHSRTASHCAPEVESGSSRGRSADIFSLGAVFLQMLVTHSYQERMAELADLTNDSGSPSFAKTVTQLHGWMEKFEQSIAHDADDWCRKILALCRKMLHEDRDHRPQAFQVLQELSSPTSLLDSTSSLCSCADARPEEGDVALVEACKGGLSDTVKELVESGKGLDPNTIGALQQASSRGHLPIVNYLLCRGANVNLKDHSGQTALHCAAGYGREEIVDTLLQHSADVTSRDSEGRTALHYAAGCGKSEIVKNLLGSSEGQASIAIRDEDGQTALHFAAKRGHKEVAEMLLDALTDTSKKIHASISDKKGRMATHFAAGFGSHELVNILLAIGLDPNAQDSKQWTILHFAARGRRAGGAYEAVVELLLKHEADASRPDQDGHTAAYYAIGGARTLLVEAIQEQEKKPKISEQGASQPAIESDELVGGNLPADFHPDFLSFITIAQLHKVNVWPLPWASDLHELGKGATGEVMQAMVDSKSQFAFKRFASLRTSKRQHHDALPRSVTSLDFQDNTRLFTALISELVILSQPEVISYRHIVDIKGITFDVEIGDQDVLEIWPVLVMDKAQHGSLMGYVSSGDSTTIDFAGRLRLCAQIGSAISTMHSNNIVHGDVKPQNILVYDDGEEVIAKVTDFSYSCISKSEEDIVKLPRSEPWHAPEYVQTGIQLGAAKLMDIFSFGMVCFWLLFPAAFDELMYTGEGRIRGIDVANVQTTAAELASKEISLELSTRESLAKFFNATLCRDPRERTRDWQELINLLGQKLLQTHDEQQWSAGTRRLTLVDYGATPQDIKDPEKLRALTLRILSSLRLTGKDYDVMRQHLDSTKFTDKQKTEEYINTVLEGLSMFAVPSLEKDKDMLIKLKHDCFNISFALYQLTKLDYRVRIHIARCLQNRANGSCDQCAKLAAFELAFCYALGFGVDSNKAEADKWLGQSGISVNELSARLDYLKDLTTADHETVLESGSQSIEHFFFSPEGRYGVEKLGSAEAYLAREIHDFERQLGDNHWQTFQLKADLIHLLSAQEKLSEAIKASEEFRLGTLERYGDSHILHIKAMLLLADLHAEQHHWDEAETLLYNAKTSLFKKFGPGFLLSIQACGTLARVYADRGKYEEAEAEFKQLMAVIPETLHADHHYVTQAAVRYSDLLDKREKYIEANELRSWYMQESTMSNKFAALARENNRGREVRLQGNSSEAIKILTRVKQDAEKLVSGQSGGANNGFWQAAMAATRNLALAIRDQKRFQEAEVMQRDLKMNREDKNGLLHEETLNITFDLARTLQMQEKWTEAKELQLRVKHGRTENLGWAADETLYCSEHLINIYEAQGELTSAENEMQTIQNAYMERYGSNHKRTLEATQRLANMYLLHNKIESAQIKLETFISLSQVIQGPYHEDTLGAQSNLALSYKAQGRLQDAEELLQKTLQDMQRHLRHGHQFISITRNHLAEVRILLLYPTSDNFFEPTVLSEDEQIQMAIEASLRAYPGMLEKDNENDEDGDEDKYEDEEETLRRAIAMSLEVEEEEPTTEMS